MSPRLLDLFCGAGGAAVGYARAGFDVVGVDIAPQPNYPFEFVQADALDYLDDLYERPLHVWYEAIHASPPCQFATSMQSVAGNAHAHTNLIPQTRELLKQTGLPYVIENVVGAKKHLRSPFILCGTMFGLSILESGVYKQLRRHRLFETNFYPGLLPQCRHGGKAVGIYGDHLRYGRRSSDGQESGAEALRVGSHIMGIDWMTWPELVEAIPPAYTELIGEQLVRHLSLESEAVRG